MNEPGQHDGGTLVRDVAIRLPLSVTPWVALRRRGAGGGTAEGGRAGSAARAKGSRRQISLRISATGGAIGQPFALWYDYHLCSPNSRRD
uniref:Uncharacterized protein n=1 Tax=Setaria italica TaxID=4555 RepID=K3YB74_SETIT